MCTSENDLARVWWLKRDTSALCGDTQRSSVTNDCDSEWMQRRGDSGANPATACSMDRDVSLDHARGLFPSTAFLKHAGDDLIQRRILHTHVHDSIVIENSGEH